MRQDPIRAVGIAGSPSRHSRSRLLVERMLSRLAAGGACTTLIALAELPADALLGRTASPDIRRALDDAGVAHVVVASTPVYRATYSGLLKVFFDLMSADALCGAVGVPVATGGSPAHALMIDHGLRPLFVSLGAATVAGGVYAADAEFDDGPRQDELLARADSAADEAATLAGALRVSSLTR